MATSKVDLSLEDIIKLQKKSGRGGGQRGRGGRGRGSVRGRGGLRGRGGSRGRGFGAGGINRDFRGVARGGVRGFRRSRPPMPYMRSTQMSPKGQNYLFEGVRQATNVSGTKEGTLMISNLEFGVNDADITELFSEFGALKKSAVHYDRSGRSLGTAEVIFDNSQSAIKAMKQYNNVPLDGKPMKIALVGGEFQNRNVVNRIGTTAGQRGSFRSRGGRGLMVRGGRGSFQRGFIQPRRGNTGRGRGNTGRGQRGSFRGNKRGRGRGGQKASLSKEALDAQLDAYNSKMDIN